MLGGFPVKTEANGEGSGEGWGWCADRQWNRQVNVHAFVKITL